MAEIPYVLRRIFAGAAENGIINIHTARQTKTPEGRLEIYGN